MLRHLLGHWKAHRRKPSLLPEDLESPSDDPSKVNPIFEDSEGSVTSSQRHDPDSPKSDRISSTGIDLDLVDVSIPGNPSVDKSNDIEENPDDVINQINLALDSSFVNENENSEEQIKSTPEPKHKDTAEDFGNKSLESEENSSMAPEKPETNENKPRMSRLHQIIKSNPELKKELTSDMKTIQRRPSATENKVPGSKPSEQPYAKENQMEGVLPAVSAKSEEPPAIPSTSTGITADSSQSLNASSAPNTDLVSEKKPKSNLKKRAIDELIKKFQGQNSENETPNQIISSFLHSSNRKEVSENQGLKENDKSQGLEVENKKEKESLSKIFSFPPPPPLEPQKNNLGKEKTEIKDIKSIPSSPISKSDKSSVPTDTKTRTDSSLSRNKTVSSRDVVETSKQTPRNEKGKLNKPESTPNETNSGSASKPISVKQSKTEIHQSVEKKEKEILKEPSQSSSKEKPTSSTPTKAESKQPEEIRFKSSRTTSAATRKESSTSITVAKAKVEKQTPSPRKHTDSLAKSSRSPDSKQKSSASKPAPDVASTLKEKEDPKTNSEDSGITRGDQISSEVTPEVPRSEPQAKEEVTPTPAKRNSKERRTMQSRGKSCKRCKRFSYDGEVRLKRGQCDEYYDVLTGLHRPHRSKYSDSWASDLSPEEKDIIRRFRSRRGTLRSNAPSTKSRHSRQPRNFDKGYFHRHHAVRRSVSDDSTFASSSACSCDDCWLFLVKDYAYGRASLRGITPDQPLCTCRLGRPEFLGRRVKFRSDTIPEASLSERTSTSPPIPEETGKKEDMTDTRSTSNLSSMSQESVLRNGKVPAKTEKKGKSTKETYRLVTPWELEEWDLAMKRHLLQKRRKRARYMGFMALAMVVFIGLVVAILMVYLRRKVL